MQKNNFITVRGFTPKVGENCFIAPNADIIGDVEIGDDCSIWFQAIVRGDVNAIRIGNRVNIQDGAIIHCTYQKTQVHIGDRVSIGHRAIVHGCSIHNNVLIGMGAIIMDNAIIEENCVVGAGAIVTEGMHLKSGGIYVGAPARRIKELSPEQQQFMIERTAENYVMYSDWFKE